MPESRLADAEDPVIAIGVRAARVGLSVSAIRKYENDGLILACRADGGAISRAAGPRSGPCSRANITCTRRRAE